MKVFRDPLETQIKTLRGCLNHGTFSLVEVLRPGDVKLPAASIHMDVSSAFTASCLSDKAQCMGLGYRLNRTEDSAMKDCLTLHNRI